MQYSSWRTLGHGLLIVFSACLLIVGLSAWVTWEGRNVGILQGMPLGIPAWHLIVPVYGAASLVILLRRSPGAYWYLAYGHFFFIFAVGLLLFISSSTLQARLGLNLTIWVVLIFVLGLFANLLAIAMAMGETAPLDAPAAWLVYLGRFQHLRELQRLAVQQGWQVTGPQPPQQTLTVAGRQDGRDVVIRSGQIVFAADSSQTGFFYTVFVAAKSVLPPLAIAVGGPLPDLGNPRDALRGQCHLRGRRHADFFLWNAEGLTLAPDATERVRQALERGHQFLGGHSTLLTHPNAISYVRRSAIRTTDNADWMNGLLGWLADVASTLEGLTTLTAAARPVQMQAQDSLAQKENAQAPVAAPRPAPSTPSSLAGRALLAVLLTIGFYVLALVIAAVLLAIPFVIYETAHRVDVRIFFACIMGAGAILWSILPRRDRFLAPGPRLLAADHPRLFQEVETVAAQTSQAMPREIYLVLDANAGVMERGGVMGIGSRRVMIVGLALLQTLTVSQMRGVLAHEFGHFYGGDTRLGPWIYKTRDAIGRTIQNLQGSTWLQSPFRWYGLLFLRITQAISRRQEFVADHLAAGLVGPQAFAEGLQIVHGIGEAFDVYLQQEYLPALENGFRPPLLEGFDRFVHATRVTRAIEDFVAERVRSQETDPFDSHPSLGERLAALEGLPAGVPEDDTGRALSLLGDAAAAEATMLAHIVQPAFRNTLRAVSWDDIGETVYLPQWREAARRYAAGLAGVTPAALPEFLAAPAALADQIRSLAGRTLLDHEVGNSVIAVTSAALVACVAQQGWTVDATPGIPFTLRRGEQTLEPFADVARLAGGQMQAEVWRQRCRELGIGQLALAGEDMG